MSHGANAGLREERSRVLGLAFLVIERHALCDGSSHVEDVAGMVVEVGLDEEGDVITWRTEGGGTVDWVGHCRA